MKNLFTIITLISVIFANALTVSEAIEQKNLPELKRILSENPELINRKDGDMLTPLNKAAINGNAEIFTFLINNGADINIGDREGSTAIHNAAANNQFEIVKLILGHKLQDVNITDDFGMTALLFAMRSDNPKLIKYLLEKGIDVNHKSDVGRGALLSAAIWGNLEVVQMLLDAGVDVNQRNENGVVALHSASSYGHLEVVKQLVEAGADFRLETNQGDSPVDWAVARNRVEILKFYVSKGYDVNTVDEAGRSLLHKASWGNPKVAEYLLTQGLDPNLRDNNGATPLHLASWGSSYEMIKILIKAGADVNVVSDSGDTPLINAARTDSLNIINALLEAGANPNPMKYNSNISNSAAVVNNPINIAVQYGKIENARVLLKNGAEVNFFDKTFYRQPLHFAAMKGQLDMVKLLINNGAEVNRKDADKHRPLYYAKKYAHTDLADYLQNRKAKSRKLKGSDCCDLLSAKINPNESVIWYLNHSGWAVRNGDKLLVFDYWVSEAEPDNLSLNNGHLCREELEDLDVYIFASHIHRDHYDEKIWQFADMSNVHYIMGFQPETQHSYEFIPDHQTRKVGDVKISTITSNDTGQGFLVTVNNQTIFHAGDHANRTRDFSGNYLTEINFLKEVNGIIDIAFMPISGCNFGDQEAVRLGVHKTCEILKPRLFIPMHSGGNPKRYRDFVIQAREDGLMSSAAYALNNGDRLIYKIGEGAR